MATPTAARPPRRGRRTVPGGAARLPRDGRGTATRAPAPPRRRNRDRQRISGGRRREGDSAMSTPPYDATTLRLAAAAAIRAPSLLNSQPWLLRLHDGDIELLSDPAR